MARFSRANNRSKPRGWPRLLLLVVLAYLWTVRFNWPSQHGSVPESVLISPKPNHEPPLHSRDLKHRLVPESAPIPSEPRNEPPLYSRDLEHTSVPESAPVRPPMAQPPVYFESKTYRPSGANVSSAAAHVPLTWEAIDFGTHRDAAQTFYEGALNPPVWNQTNWTHAIFYHFRNRNLDLVKEQVGQMAYAAPSNVVTPVFYSLTYHQGYRTLIEKIFARYPSLSLHYLAYDANSMLNSVRDYCVRQAESNRTTTRVTYLHTKHDHRHHWQRALTAGALHPDCLQPLDPSTNACGLQFFTRFSVFFPGNMWTARL